MDKGRMLLGAVVLTLLGLAIGYVLATIYFAVQYGHSTRSFDLTLLARNWLGLRTSAPQDFLWVNGIILGTGLAALLLTATMLGDALTRFGTTHWQSRAEMKRNGFFAGSGAGFLLGKMGSPKSKKPFIVSRTFPHALVVAPTGRGKGVGFVIPNLLTYRGSAVVLDVKGENFRETSRFRASTGDKVFRFAPTDWERPTHRYNPLARIAALKNPDRQQMELKLTAKLFLQTDNEKLSGLLAGGIDLFVAAGLLAFERGNPTIGEIYRITASGGNKQLEFLKRAEEVKNPSAKLIFERMASTNNDTLTSYLSLLMTSGLDTWDNRAIDAATATSDFSFRDIRRQPHAIYLVVESEMVGPLAPLIRLFFSDLIASLQAAEPGRRRLRNWRSSCRRYSRERREGRDQILRPTRSRCCEHQTGVERWLSRQSRSVWTFPRLGRLRKAALRFRKLSSRPPRSSLDMEAREPLAKHERVQSMPSLIGAEASTVLAHCRRSCRAVAVQRHTQKQSLDGACRNFKPVYTRRCGRSSRSGRPQVLK